MIIQTILGNSIFIYLVYVFYLLSITNMSIRLPENRNDQQNRIHDVKSTIMYTNLLYMQISGGVDSLKKALKGAYFG